MKRPDEHEFHSMTGVRAKRVKGIMAKTVNGFMVGLRTYRAVSDAGDHGSVLVYRDDSGAFRCHFVRWRQSVNEEQFESQAKVRAWLKKWLPVQRQQPEAQSPANAA